MTPSGAIFRRRSVPAGDGPLDVRLQQMVGTRYAGITVASAEPVVCTTCELHAEAVFRVEGMDCNEEVVILERRLRPLVGLEALSADLIGQRLHVKYDAAKLTTSAMVDAVGETGMRMWLEHEEPVLGGSVLGWRWKLMLACGGLLVSAAVLAMLGLPRAALPFY